MLFIYLFYFNFNQQSEFTFYKLMLWLLQCHDEKSSSGESSVPQIRSIGQFLLSRLFSSLTSSVLRSGFTWVTSVVWCLLHFWWMTSCTYDMPRSACNVAFETYHGASTIVLRILDRLLWIIDMLDLLAQPHNSRPYVQIGMIMVLYIRSLFSIARFDFLPSSQFNCLIVMLTCFRFLTICCLKCYLKQN
jgi:hypothetical protein